MYAVGFNTPGFPIQAQPSVFESFVYAFAALSGIALELGWSAPDEIICGDVDVSLPGCDVWIRDIA
jgi:hypothetical protein